MKKVLLAPAIAVAAAALVTGPSPIVAPAQAQERVSQLVVYGNDPCPAGSETEVFVCVRLPDNERYRIPRELREGERTRGGESWAARAESIEYVGATGIQSCSTVGPGGFTGCWNEMMRQAQSDRSRPQPRPRSPR